MRVYVCVRACVCVCVSTKTSPRRPCDPCFWSFHSIPARCRAKRNRGRRQLPLQTIPRLVEEETLVKHALAGVGDHKEEEKIIIYFFIFLFIFFKKMALFPLRFPCPPFERDDTRGGEGGGGTHLQTRACE